MALSGHEIVVSSVDVTAGQIKALGAGCPTGKYPLGGGFTFNGPCEVRASAPRITGGGSPHGDGWIAEVKNTDSITRTLQVFVICAEEV